MTIQGGASSQDELVNRYRASFASDAPSNDDELDAHERVASSMDRLIDQSHGGKTIALEGRWGSGKSSVIQMLAEKCRARNTLVHQYDAWAHAGDPLRRAFLSSLIDFLTDAGWLKNVAQWRAELEILAGKRRESEKTTSPLLTTFGFFLAMSLLLLPGGIYCFGHGVESVITAGSIHIPRWSAFLFWLGATLCISPVFLCLGNIAYCKCKKVPRPDYLAIALNKQVTTEKTSITENGDQSTIEFQRVFGDLVSAALSECVTRKLVLVIDNLDRIDVGDVSNVWSLLQSFIDIPRFAAEAWHDRLWVIVPIASELDRQGPESSAVQNFGASFLDKVFQARFRLPPPILKKWRPYLEKRLYASLAGLGPEDCETVTEMFLASLKPGELPTPRELVLFVNQLAIFAEQWGIQYAVPVGAAYILDRVDANLPRLVSGDVPNAGMQRLVQVDLKAAYASIYFNTGDEADALDLLQRPLASKLLSERDSSGISRNLVIHVSFSHVLQRVLSEKLGVGLDVASGLGLQDIRTIARALCDPSLTASRQSDRELDIRVVTLKARLARDVCSIIEEARASVRFAKGYGDVIGLLLVDEYSNDLLSAVVSELTTSNQVQSIDQGLLNSDEQLAVYGANTAQLLDLGLVNAQLRSTKKQAFVVTSGLAFARFLDGLGEADESNLTLIKPVNDRSGEESYLRGEIASGDFGAIDINIMRWLLAHGVSVASISLGALDEYVGKATEIGAMYVESVTSATLDCSLSVTTSLGMGEHLSSTRLLSTLMDGLLESEAFDAAAELVLLVASTWPSSLDAPTEIALKKTTTAKFLAAPSGTPDLLTALRSAIGRLRMEAWLLDRAGASREFAPLFLEYFNPLNAAEGVLAEHPVARVVDLIDTIVSSAPARASDLIDLAIGLHRGASEMVELLRHALPSINKWRWLARAAAGVKDADACEAVASFIEKEFELVTAQEWSSSYSPFGWRERSLIALHAIRPGYTLNTVADLVRSLLVGWTTPSPPGGWAPELALPFVEVLRKGLQLQIGREEAERIIKTVPNDARAYWIVAAPMLDRWMASSASHGELPSIVNAIVDAGDRHALDWLVTAIESHGELRKLVGDDAFRGEIHRQVRERINAIDAADDVSASLALLKRTVARCARSKSGSKRKRR